MGMELLGLRLWCFKAGGTSHFNGKCHLRSLKHHSRSPEGSISEALRALAR